MDNDRRAALVERVRTANGCIACPPNEKCYCQSLIDVVLEEAAKIGDIYASYIGDAIRALKN